MSQWMLCSLITVLAWTTTLVEVSYSDVFTSSKKIEDMVLLEEQMLNNLHTAVIELRNETALMFFLRFYRDRMSRIERRNAAGLQGLLKHPNGIYHSIKQFATKYETIRSALGSATSSSVQKCLSLIASQRDIVGARLSFLRLQTVYNLTVSDMIRGDYFGFVGPELSYLDVIEIGEAALNEGRLNCAILWLQEALELTRRREPTAGFGNTEGTIPLTGRILALLGRVYVRQGDQERAAEMYSKARNSGPPDTHVIELERELNSKPGFKTPWITDENFKRLCTLQTKLPQGTFDQRLNCIYRDVILPYYRFKQELVSVSPYVSLFYEVITSEETEILINSVNEKLQRGHVELDGTSIVHEVRTSDLSFVYDEESPVAASMSKRVGAITSLNTSPYSHGIFYADPFQIVNYGMGGHYDVHIDPFEEISIQKQHTDNKYKEGGNRIATFLIYLSDVERGGSTVFPLADIAVSPVKNMALFWYNFKPSGELDLQTHHAACPVVIGHKWVTNKWIWTYGNTFTRRCGLTENATQLDIDQYMRRGWA